MKLILTTEVEHLGSPGDTVEVKDGYGRNYLLPRGLAIVATRGAQRQANGGRRGALVAGELDAHRALVQLVARGAPQPLSKPGAQLGAEPHRVGPPRGQRPRGRRRGGALADGQAREKLLEREVRRLQPQRLGL